MTTEELRLMVAENLGVPLEEVGPQTVLTVDSLSLTEIIVQVEAVCDFVISDAEASTVSTFADLLKLVQGKI